MAANTAPIYVKEPQLEWGVVTTANTAKDGTGTMVTVFTGATDGSYLDRLRIRPAGTNVATVLRIFLNNSSSNATPGNNSYYGDVTLPATTNTETAALTDFTVLMGLGLPAGWKVNVAIGTTVAGGYHITGIGGKY
jgi:hypothetical protein